MNTMKKMQFEKEFLAAPNSKSILGLGLLPGYEGGNFSQDYKGTAKQLLSIIQQRESKNEIFRRQLFYREQEIPAYSADEFLQELAEKN